MATPVAPPAIPTPEGADRRRLTRGRSACRRCSENCRQVAVDVRQDLGAGKVHEEVRPGGDAILAGSLDLDQLPRQIDLEYPLRAVVTHAAQGGRERVDGSLLHDLDVLGPDAHLNPAGADRAGIRDVPRDGNVPAGEGDLPAG